MFIKKFFVGLDREFLVKKYIVSAILTFIAYQGFFGSSQLSEMPVSKIIFNVVFLVVWFVLFPFSILVWDLTIGKLGSYIASGSSDFVIFFYTVKIVVAIVKYMFLYIFAPIIAIVGLTISYFNGKELA